MSRQVEKRLTITGGNGFLGKHLIAALRHKGYEHIAVADLPEYNLVRVTDIRRMYRELKPDVVIHLAAKVGGIGFNQENPASLFYENAMMGIQLLHEGYRAGINKFVALGTICAYPKFTPVPFREDDLWNGYPEETNAPYGLAKKMMLVQSQAYRQQYGFNSIFLLPVNLYGPGDNFRFSSSHVIPALIRKLYLAERLAHNDFDGIIRDFLINRDSATIIGDKKIAIKPGTPQKDVQAVLKHYGIYLAHTGPSFESLHSTPNTQNPKLNTQHPTLSSTVSIWGTGAATREFFYVEDAAKAIVAATEKYNKSDAVNIGAGFEISIRDLIHLIAELMDFKGQIVFDHTKPDGQPRRQLETTRAQKEFGFVARTSFREGLRKTIAWYLKTRRSCGS